MYFQFILPFIFLLLIFFLVMFAASKTVKTFRLLHTFDEEMVPDINFSLDMRGRLGEFQRMKNWCQDNIGKIANDANLVNKTTVFYIGKKQSVMQFVFLNQHDFELFSQHWNVYQVEIDK